MGREFGMAAGVTLSESATPMSCLPKHAKDYTAGTLFGVNAKRNFQPAQRTLDVVESRLDFFDFEWDCLSSFHQSTSP